MPSSLPAGRIRPSAGPFNTSVEYLSSISFVQTPRRFGTSQWGAMIHVISAVHYPVPFRCQHKASAVKCCGRPSCAIFSCAIVRFLWDTLLWVAARSCAFMWVPVFNGPVVQVKLSKSTASPWATNGHPRIPLTLGRDDACRSIPPSWMQPSILVLEALRACRPTFPFIQLLPA